jgi:putative spermidine/putrescine transport system permease protein
VADATLDQAALTTADGRPLKQSLAFADRRKKIVALGLVFPLLAFILVTFAFPIAEMLFRSVDNPRIAKFLPNTIASLKDWHGAEGELPGEATYAALAEDLVAATKTKDIGKVATRLNYDISGIRSALVKTGRSIVTVETGPYKDRILKLHRKWGEIKTWAALKRAGVTLTGDYYLHAVDLTYNVNDEIVEQPETRQIYVTLFVRTLWISLIITGACILLAYPIAYLMATVPTRISNLLIILVLLPFWTSLLVRTTSWIALMQSQGVVNDILVWAGFVSEEGRIQMMHNMAGTVIAMIHILLPFMVLPTFSVMKTISPYHVRAAKSLGATPARAFWTVYFPQSIAGIGAGSILVFILSIGYYITPALVGGASGQLISNLIAFHMQRSLNWGLAAALGTILLACVIVLYWLYNRLIGIDNMKMG